MHIREEMLAAVDVHVLESGPEADAFLATTGSHSGEACIWTDGEQIVVFARPEATVEDIAHEAGHLEQLFSASKGPLVRELYDAVPDLATWEALGEAGLYAEQLRLYKLKLGLEIDLHETQRAARQAAGDVEGVLEAEQTLAELRGLQQRAEAVTAEELAAGPVKLLEGAPPWLFTGERERLASKGAVRQGGEVLGAEGGVQPLGHGTTVDPSKGRFHHRNLRERLAVDEAMQNPAAGHQAAGPLGDARWPAADGWVKYQQTVMPGGRGGPVSVHYNFNTVTGAVDDFKIVERRPYVPPPDPNMSPTGQ